MVIKGTDNIKGVLDLSSIGLQLKKTSSFSISDKDYWNSDVQSAIRLGFIVGTGSPENTDNPKKVVKCINSYHRPISLKILSMQEIKPGHTFTMAESKLNHPDIRAAVSKGMITVTQVIDPSDASEGFMSIGDLFKEQEAKKKKKKESQAKEFKNKRANRLETNEDLPLITKIVEPTTIIDEENPEPVRADTADKTKGIVWNPTKKEGIKDAITTKKPAGVEVVNGEEQNIPKSKKPEGQIATHIIDKPDPAPVDPVQNDPYKKSLVVNPTGAKITNTIKEASVWNPLNEEQHTKTVPASKNTSSKEQVIFVDEEAEKDRVKSHPKLSKQKFEKQENDPIAPDSLDEARIAKHPVLGKEQQKQNTELDFIG